MIDRPRPQSKVSLEDLLRLKRAERPNSAFWSEFESELRRKQLAAIMVKRPWWRRVSLAGLRKLSVPVGAAAVLAVTLLTLRDQQTDDSALSDDLAVIAAPTSDSAISASSAAVASDSQSTATELATTTSLENVASDQVAAVTAASSPVGATSAVADAAPRNLAREVSPIDATYALAQVVLGFADQPEADKDSVLDRPSLASVSSPMTDLRSLSENAAGGVVDPSMEVGYSRDLRGNRLLASLDSSYGSEVMSESRVERARERITSRLTEQALYDSISRLGVNANKVSIKF